MKKLKFHYKKAAAASFCASGAMIGCAGACVGGGLKKAPCGRVIGIVAVGPFALACGTIGGAFFLTYVIGTGLVAAPYYTVKGISDCIHNAKHADIDDDRSIEISAPILVENNEKNIMWKGKDSYSSYTSLSSLTLFSSQSGSFTDLSEEQAPPPPPIDELSTTPPPPSPR